MVWNTSYKDLEFELVFFEPDVTAGKICFSLTKWNKDHRWFHSWNFHLVIEKEYRLWGYQQDWYDGPLHYFGLGPLFLACWN